jgi:hypothetical protein
LPSKANQELAEALVHVPIDGAEVVALDVVAVVGELDAAALLLRAPLGSQASGEDAARDERQHFELALELVVEKLDLARALRLRSALTLEEFEDLQGRLPWACKR